jgi:hypothetical protein
MERELRELPADVVVAEPLDPAEGPERLARHGMHELARELAATASAEDQAERLNGVLRQLRMAENGCPSFVALSVAASCARRVSRRHAIEA